MSELFNRQVHILPEKDADALFGQICAAVPPRGADVVETLAQYQWQSAVRALSKNAYRLDRIDQEGFHDVVIKNGNIYYSELPSKEKKDYIRLPRLSDASQSFLILFLKHFPEPLTYFRMLECRAEWKEIYDSLCPVSSFEDSVGRVLDKCIKDNTPLTSLMHNYNRDIECRGEDYWKNFRIENWSESEGVGREYSLLGLFNVKSDFSEESPENDPDEDTFCKMRSEIFPDNTFDKLMQHLYSEGKFQCGLILLKTLDEYCKWINMSRPECLVFVEDAFRVELWYGHLEYKREVVKLPPLQLSLLMLLVQNPSLENKDCLCSPTLDRWNEIYRKIKKGTTKTVNPSCVQEIADLKAKIRRFICRSRT